MNWEHKMDMDAVRYIVLGISVIIILAILMFNPLEITRYDRQSIEVQVIKKEIAEADGDEIYLLHCQEQDGKQDVFEINAESIGERFERADVYRQIKTEKYYKFRVAQKEEFDSRYPSICGAVKLIDGFSETTEAQGK